MKKKKKNCRLTDSEIEFFYKIIRLTALYTNVSETAILSKLRNIEIVDARALAVEYLRMRKNFSSLKLACLFNKDHVTILHYRKVMQYTENQRRWKDYEKFIDKNLSLEFYDAGFLKIADEYINIDKIKRIREYKKDITEIELVTAEKLYTNKKL